MKYKVGDRVRIKSLDWYNENKTIHGDIWFDNAVFVGGQSLYCGCELTIRLVTKDSYYVVENDYYWTDEMIECKVEEECPQDFIEEYCKPCGTQRCNRTKEFLDGCPYYNAYMCKKQNNAVEEEIKPKYEDEVNGEYYSTPKYLVRPSGYKFVDENGNVINATKIVLEKKGKEYPKTYEECCEIIHSDPKFYVDTHLYSGTLETLYKLLVCRDAYWKIAGDEMGLGKPWEPSDSDYITGRYCIFVHKGNIICSTPAEDCPLTFPTEEMRDAFKENFDPDIKICKEFL